MSNNWGDKQWERDLDRHMDGPERELTRRAVRTHTAELTPPDGYTAALKGVDVQSLMAGRDLSKPPLLTSPEARWDVYACQRKPGPMKRVHNNMNASAAAMIARTHLGTYPKGYVEIRETTHGTRWAYVPVPGIWGPVVQPNKDVPIEGDIRYEIIDSANPHNNSIMGGVTPEEAKQWILRHAAQFGQFAGGNIHLRDRRTLKRWNLHFDGTGWQRVPEVNVPVVARNRYVQLDDELYLNDALGGQLVVKGEPAYLRNIAELLAGCGWEHP